MAAIALMVMAGCARVSTEHVQKSIDVLPRPQLILVHDYRVSPDEVQLDSALSSRVKRAVKGTPKTEDQLKVEQEVSRVLTTTLVDEIRKLGIPAEAGDDGVPGGGADPVGRRPDRVHRRGQQGETIGDRARLRSQRGADADPGT